VSITALFSIKNLKKWYPVRENLFSRSKEYVRAVDGVSFELMEGETLGLVGESGSGKSTLGRILVRLEQPTSGEVISGGRNIFDLKGRDLVEFRKSSQIVFQDPRGSLNPRKTVGSMLVEPILVHGISDRTGARVRAAELLDMVGLSSGIMPRYPHEFSGGERQRICIARALTVGPKFIVADEPVTALDVSVQGQIVNLLCDLQQKLGLTYLFIAHDLCLVSHTASRIVVMYLGKIVEIAPSDRLFTNPGHPYTKALLTSMPGVDREGEDKKTVPEDEPGDASRPPPGCVYHPRCGYATPMCRREQPVLGERDEDHYVACIL